MTTITKIGTFAKHEEVVRVGVIVTFGQIGFEGDTVVIGT